MITDARVLQPEFVPSELHHRDGAIEAISAALDPITYGQRGQDVLLTGPSGSGKTTIARHVLRMLERQTLDVRWGYANCMSGSSASSVLHRVVNDARLGRDLRRTGTAADVYLDRLRDADEQVVIVLDEIDLLEEPSLLGSLYGEPGVTLVLICIDEDELLSDLDERVASRLRSFQRHRLDKYSHNEMVDIVGSRADYGIRSITDDAVATIADLAAGDARHGIALLGRAARHAESNGLDEIDSALVQEIEGVARDDVRQRHVRTLGTDMRLLYEIVQEAGTISATSLHRQYEQQATDPKTKRQRRRNLSRLEDYGLIDANGNKRGTEYQSTTTGT